jgi:hypothetical protein
MHNLDLQLNKMLMDEMGLEEGERRRVIDRDTEEICCLGTREIVIPGCQSGKNAVELDLINNPRMMTTLFSEFVDKLAEEESIDQPCTSFGIYQEPDKKNRARIIFDDGSYIDSSSYKNEGLCLAEMIFRLNGEDKDLTKYDFDRPKEPRQGMIKPADRKNFKGGNKK